MQRPRSWRSRRRNLKLQAAQAAAPAVPARRVLLPGAFLLILLLLLYFSARRETMVSRTEFLMDTLIEVRLYDQAWQGQDLKEELQDVFSLLKEIEAASNPYKPGTGNLYELNQAGGEPFSVSPHIFRQLQAALPFSLATEGDYNLALLNAESLWKKAQEEGQLPSGEALRESLKAASPQGIILNEGSGSVRLLPGMSLDLGSVAKGYALDQAYQHLKKKVSGALINAGGNIMALGAPEGREGYRVALQDPLDPKGILGEVLLTDHMAVSTSGSYNRFYRIQDQSYSHILSGKTGYPGDRYLAVTVLTDQGIYSDILSTLLFLLPVEEGLELVKEMGISAEVLYLTLDRKILATEGFPITYANNLPYQLL